ncbi:MAG: hypothetical protein R3B94_15380 [Hyphomonas sp.]|jgi:hypothetical protein
MKRLLFCSAILLVAACASTSPYGPAAKSGAMGYDSLQIESNRFRVSYTDTDAAKARDRALLRAAEITLEQGKDWFEVTNSYASDDTVNPSGSRTSISIGGSTGSYGRSSVGVGVGFGIPLGSSSSGKATEVLEIMIGAGEKPDRPNVYDARSVDINLRGAATS